MSSNRQGEFIWYELTTSDPEAASRFYAEVIGWTIAGPLAGSHASHWTAKATSGSIAAIMTLDDGLQPTGATAGWLSYIAVDDVDETTNAIIAAGGRALIAPRDVEKVGRLAMVADPQGAHFYVMRLVPAQHSNAFATDLAGHCSWNELSTTDQAEAHSFYEGLFGWTSHEAMPMGSMGDYRFLDAGSVRIGASLQDASVRAHWRPYFRVPSIRAAADAIADCGGTILRGPHEVPGGDHIIMGHDPQGAPFAIVGLP